MSETAVSSTLRPEAARLLPAAQGRMFLRGWRVVALMLALFLVSAASQIDRMLPFVLAEAIKTDLSLSDTQIGLLTGIAFAICYTLLSMPLAWAADRHSPRLVLVACVLLWSAMTSLGGLATGFLILAMTRFGVAFGEAGGTPAAHAIIVRRIDPARRGLALGVFSMGIPIGTMIGFAAGGALGDSVGWRMTLVGAGLMGLVIALLVFVMAGPTPPVARPRSAAEPFLRASLRLLQVPAFRWLFIGSILLGFAAAPFYAFTVPFLIRTHGYSAGEAGLAFGLLQGLFGIVGTLAGGRVFDRAVRAGKGNLIGPPAILFLIAGVTTTAALFAPIGWLAILLFVPAMLSFAFLLPGSFGSAHLVAGKGKEAMATSIVMVGSGLLGPALGPLIVGVISDAAAAADVANGLGLGLMVVPLASLLAGLALLAANRRIAEQLTPP